MNPRVVRTLSYLLFIAIALATPAHAIANTNPAPFLNPLVPAAIASGGPQFTLTVTGTGFVNGSVVQWNGAALTTVFVSKSKLTATVPASKIVSPTTATITVFSAGPGGGVSNFQYLEVSNAVTQLYFSSRDLSTSVPLTSRIVGGDFNNDGKLDLAVALGSNVYVLLGDGDGTFPPAIGSAGPAGSTITGLYVADFNGDGNLDLIVTGSKGTSQSFVATLFGKGDGTFMPPVETDFSGSIPTTAVLADFNGDGVLDLVYATASSIQTLLGNANGSFHTGPSSPLSQIGLGAVATGDFNNDGNLDLVVTVYDPFTTGIDFVGVMLGNGDGSFGTLAALSGTGSAFAGAITAVVGDFNGDGNLDIATGIQTAGATIQGFIQISLGNGDGTFQSASYVPNVNSVTTPLLVGDFNGDGNLDLATGGAIYFGQGNGSFPQFQGSTNVPTFVLAGDVNGDGSLDIIDETVTLNGTTVLTKVGLELQIPPTPDFKGIVTPFSATLIPGGSMSFSVTVEPLHGFTGDVILGVTGLPAGITPSYNPVLVPGGNGTSTVTLSAATTVPLGTYSVTLTGNSGSLSHWTTLPLSVSNSVGDWTGYAVQQTQNIAPGGTATYTIVTSSLNGFDGNIGLNVSGLPPGATASFNPPTITGGSGSSVLSVFTTGGTPQPQIFNLTITGTDGTLVHSTLVYLGVRSGAGDFSGTLTPSQVTVAAGGSALYGVTLSPVNGGAGDVTLTASGLPAGASVMFSAPTILGSNGSSAMTVTTSSGTPPGSYQIFITSTGSGVIHQGSVILVVTP